MERENIHYDTSGFVKDMKYTADLLNFLEKYKDSFGEAESLLLKMEEIAYSALNYKTNNPFTFSEDGKEVKLYFSTQKYYNKNGKLTHTPDEIEIYQSLGVFMKRAVEEYDKKFNRK